jgi:hypothetical protein
VTYDGYQVDVPVNWPVYRLDEDAYRCVRYDVHAVYLGVPGADQQCPAGLIGRTETVSILPAVRGGVPPDPGSHELRVTPSGPADVTVTATYGGDRALAQRVLGTLRPAPAVPPPLMTTEQEVITELEVTRQPGTGTSWHGLPASWPTEIVVPPPPAGKSPAGKSPARTPPPVAPVPVRPNPAAPLLGFDTCATPSLATMQAWRRDYAAVALYIGGVNAACYDGNLSASWIGSAAAMGWSMLPTYVGPQAPCYGYGTMMKHGEAAQEGTAAADDAAQDARRLGLPTGSPIYYDLEAYHSKHASCRSAVLFFLSAWTREINAKGFLSGVYSSMNSGISDIQAAQSADGPAGADADVDDFTPPQAIWYAMWDKQGELNDGTLSWPRSDRAKQFIGPHDIKVGGITMNIDTDLVGGPAVGRRPTAASGGYSVRPSG